MLPAVCGLVWVGLTQNFLSNEVAATSPTPGGMTTKDYDGVRQRTLGTTWVGTPTSLDERNYRRTGTT
jgi:hypothetical protein